MTKRMSTSPLVQTSTVDRFDRSPRFAAVPAPKSARMNPASAYLAKWLFLLILIPFMGGIGVVRAWGQTPSHDWPQFGWNLASSSAPTTPTGITAANLHSLTRMQVQLDGTVDATAIYLQGVRVKGSTHDVFFVTTTYGKTIAVDANSGKILWEYTPPKFSTWAGTRQITNSTPVADPDRQYIYAAAPDGAIRKLAISDGHAVWTTAITLLPVREKIASPLKYFNGRIIAQTDGYIGDRPPYQGHVAILDAQSGKLLHVWNSLCSDRHELIDPSSCATAQSGIWGRAGAVIDAATGDIFVSTGNGPYDGKTNWGDSLIVLSPDASRIVGNFTTKNNSELNEQDLDIGSTSPVLLGNGFIAQGGKAGLIHLLSLSAIKGSTPHMGGALQAVYTPGGARLFTAPAVWHYNGETWMFVADNAGTAAWALQKGKLVSMWKNSNAGTSPVVAGGLLYIYDPAGGLRIYNPLTGMNIATLQCGAGHWNSPIVVNGKIALPEGNANAHASTGVLNIWSLPPKL